ncbi:MAG: H-type lectin domain-containing protein [Prosthecobacter sp.]|uniref:H-type lectin domain-containing protein n=1 Tax=Prosthecobacter sp. TaxID=1965333 RepID=UPI003902AF6D
MYSSSVPWKVLSSHVAVSVLTAGWSLADIEPAAEEDIRTFTVAVAFDSPFLSVPVVQLGLTGFDMDQRDSSRISIKADGITESGFLAFITTWANTRVYAVEFNWFAIGP